MENMYAYPEQAAVERGERALALARGVSADFEGEPLPPEVQRMLRSIAPNTATQRIEFNRILRGQDHLGEGKPH